MGYRFSLYRITKDTYNKWKDLSKEEYYGNKWEDFYNEATQECVYFDTLNSIMSCDIDNKLSSPFFTQDVDDTDIQWATISKEQFLHIIEEARQKIIKWFDGRRVDGDTLGEWWKNNIHDWTPREAVKDNQREWNMKADHWKLRFTDNDKHSYMFINLEDKWKVSGGYSYEYCIFDLIHIYKIFDWDNDVLVLKGS